MVTKIEVEVLLYYHIFSLASAIVIALGLEAIFVWEMACWKQSYKDNVFMCYLLWISQTLSLDLKLS